MEYIAPEFLNNQDSDTIYEKMKTAAPSDIDTSEASFFYDATYPTAIEKSEMVEQQLNEVIKLIFPQWSYGSYLDMHAAAMGTSRKPANPSSAPVTVTGTNGTLIPKGYLFATPETQDNPSIVFAVMADATIAAGTASFNVECQTPGIVGNVAANSITLMFNTPIVGIVTITNPSAATGGTDIESDEDLQIRLDTIRKSLGGAGSKSDYEKWALEVPGIGIAVCIPEWLGAGTGTVKLVCLDSNGDPANPALIQDVYDYIAPADGGGKIPVGATLTVSAPTMKTLNYVAVITPAIGYTVSQCIVNIKAALDDLYIEIGVKGLVKYSQTFSAAAKALGVGDISSFTMNGGTANIQLAIDEFAKTGTVNGV